MRLKSLHHTVLKTLQHTKKRAEAHTQITAKLTLEIPYNHAQNATENYNAWDVEYHTG